VDPLLEFRSFTDYFRRLEAQGTAINFASYVGATTVRRMVLGDADRAPTGTELASMQELVREAMRQGAMGLSTSLMYAPAPYAKTEELVALSSAAAESGGIYATHMRSEADGIFAALDETFRIAREAHIPVEIFHLKVAGPPNWGKMPEVVKRIDGARAEGLDIAADTYAYTTSGNSFSAFLPPWAHDGGDAAMVGRLKDPAQRERIRDSIEHDRTWDNEWYMIAGPEGISISSTSSPALKSLEGKNLKEVAAARHTDAIDCLMDMLAEDPKLTVLLATMSEAEVEYALKQPWVSIGLDAGGAAPTGAAGGHPRAYGTFPRILRKYVREDGLLTLPDAIRKFSALPAQRMRFADRGVLKAGMWADVVIFDPAKVRDLASFEKPDQLAVGMEYVLVNGVPVISEGKMTAALPGKVLRGPGYVP
jgi:dihydroorotase/N-acyl-D-amino-acid deacylase